MIWRPILSVTPSGGLFSDTHLTSQLRGILSLDERHNLSSTFSPRKNWLLVLWLRIVIWIPCSETSPINTGRLLRPDIYSPIKLTIFLRWLLVCIFLTAIRQTILGSHKKTEHTKVHPSAARPSSVRPAAFRPLLTKGLALSGDPLSMIIFYHKKGPLSMWSWKHVKLKTNF